MVRKVITIKELAKKCGVSITTVSLVLNNKANNISQNTKDLIKETAEKYAYKPNVFAANMKAKNTKTVGYICPSITNPFFSEIAQYLQDSLLNIGYNLLIASTNRNYEKDKEFIEMMEYRKVDLLVYIPASDSLKKENVKYIYEKLKKTSLKYILIDRQINGLLDNKIVCDNKYGGELATNYLISHGCKNIAHISGPLDSSSATNRLEGYKQALSDNNFSINENLILEGDFTFDSGYYKTLELLDKKIRIDGIFTSNDLMGYGSIKAIKEKGLRIPEDISLIGYDSLKYDDMLDIPLTSIKQDTKDIADCIYNHLIKVIDNDDSVSSIILKPQLVERRSVREVMNNEKE